MSEQYSTIYWDAIEAFNLTPIEALMMTVVDGLSKKEGSCYASKKYLSRILNVSEQTVYNTIRRLIDKGLLEKERRSRYGTMCLAPSDRWKEFEFEIHKTLTKQREY